MKLITLLLTIFMFTQSVGAKVLLGIDVLEKNKFKGLEGKRVGLITNHTGVNGKKKSTIDILHKAPQVNLVKLFSPEHGIRGKVGHGKKIQDGKDEKTNLPVFSLYGKTMRPTPEMLADLDVLVYDIQDIGTRFYTYTTTLAYALEEAAKAGIEFVVLDRPNPITGSIVEGEPLDPSIKHFTAYLQVPVRHGMTVGELANWHKQTQKIKSKLGVVRMQGWRRSMTWKETELKFIPTSPNIRNLKAALLYPGVGGFEATNMSVGRGTKEPFGVLGAPWIGAEFYLNLESVFNYGVKIIPIEFKPKSDIYKGQKCIGVKVIIEDPGSARLVDFYMHAFSILYKLYPKRFKPRWDEIKRITGSDRFRKLIESGESVETILVILGAEAKKFKEARRPYLLYPEENQAGFE